MSPSKRKHPAPDAHPKNPSKKLKKAEPVAGDNTKQKNGKEQKNGKGKGRDREFQLVKSTMTVSVAPVFAGNPRAGVEELLDSLVMRYIPALQGVVLSHSNLTFTSDTGKIQDDCPYAICNIQFDAAVWKPIIGMKLKGRINLSSPDHISVLVHRTFNVSIPRHHIPSERWEFEYGPAENDPEWGGENDEEEKEAKYEGDEEKDEKSEDDSGDGRWVNRSTGERLGGSVEFTVIGLTVANEMLSLVGSLQLDPFSPAHMPYTPAAIPLATVAREVSAERYLEDEEDNQDVEDSEDEDGFRHLKRKAAAVEKEERTETIEKPTKKKRKAKKDKD